MYEIYAIVDRYRLSLLYCFSIEDIHRNAPYNRVRGQKQNVNAMLWNEVFAIVQASILTGWWSKANVTVTVEFSIWAVYYTVLQHFTDFTHDCIQRGTA